MEQIEIYLLLAYKHICCILFMIFGLLLYVAALLLHSLEYLCMSVYVYVYMIHLVGDNEILVAGLEPVDYC